MKEIILFEEMINTDRGAEKVMRICYNEEDLLNINTYDNLAIVLPRTIEYKDLDQFTKDEIKELLKIPIKDILNKVNNKERVTIKNSNIIEDEIKLLSKNSKEYKNNKELLTYIQENIINYERNRIKLEKNM